MQQFQPFLIEPSSSTATVEQTDPKHYCEMVRWCCVNNTQQFQPFLIEPSCPTATFEQTRTQHYCSIVRWGRENNAQQFQSLLIDLSGPTAIRTRVRGSASHCDIQATLWGLGNPSHPRLLFNNDGIVRGMGNPIEIIQTESSFYRALWAGYGGNLLQTS